ncbi:helix-turn-helix transcriptional regulator [Streptomyces sp. WAC 06738]|uniref:helix-turn-helix domain-containing protein n=1 Tax=Streptomyces sp. WAC 06738 TaxID=2203210 RepID=UPI000F768CBF|nr:helix-turn-helix transcriptional regulator [Streptomyces sp. WAC 06738]
MAVNLANMAARERFGQELKRVRLAARLDGKPVGQKQVAQALGYKQYHRYSRIERGETWPNDHEWEIICNLLGMDEVTRVRLSTKREEGMAIGSAWWTEFQDEFPASLIEFISYEDLARSVTTCAANLVPGLLQTADYGRAVISQLSKTTTTEHLVERSVELRMKRRGVFEKPNPPAVEAIIGEAALHQRVGGTDVMAEQLGQLIEDMTQRNVTVRVIPFHASSTLSYFFHLFEFSGTSEDPIAAFDGVTGMSFEKRAREIRGIRSLLDSARDLALPPADSLEIIRALKKELSRD